MNGTHRTRTRRRGVTLVEVSISTLLVGLVLVGALRSSAMVFQTWVRADNDLLALQLARDLMAEVRQSHYEEPVDPILFGIEIPEVLLGRAAWDDVDDYHGWSATPPQRKDGTAITGYDGWTRACTVEFLDVDDPTNTTGIDEGLKRVTVTVTDPGGNQTVLVGYRSEWGALEADPPASGTIQTRVESTIETSGGNAVRGGTNLVNNAEDGT